MFRLTREVRFAATSDHGSMFQTVTNGYAGFPTISRFIPWYALQITLAGELDRKTSYLQNIVNIDATVRETAIPVISRRMMEEDSASLLTELFDLLRFQWAGCALEALKLLVSPMTHLSIVSEEYPMIRTSQKFEFSASHRLHNSDLSDSENRAAFGKCNNAAGHGHNYEVQVTVNRNDGDLSRLIDLERAVKPVIDLLDHRYLNVEVPAFEQINPTVENIAKFIFGQLKPAVAELASITVWETAKTWCEYSE